MAKQMAIFFPAAKAAATGGSYYIYFRNEIGKFFDDQRMLWLVRQVVPFMRVGVVVVQFFVAC